LKQVSYIAPQESLVRVAACLVAIICSRPQQILSHDNRTRYRKASLSVQWLQGLCKKGSLGASLYVLLLSYVDY